MPLEVGDERSSATIYWRRRLFADFQLPEEARKQDDELGRGDEETPEASTEMLIYRQNSHTANDEKSIWQRVLSRQSADCSSMRKSKRQILSPSLGVLLLLLVGGAETDSSQQHAQHGDWLEGLKYGVSPPTQASKQATTPAPAFDNKTRASETSSTNTDSVNTISNRIKVPGLYDERENPWITPLQGQVNFERSIVYTSRQSDAHRPANQTTESATGDEAVIALIQYYMATCPDCQGFSPYFKRFVWDIGPHWRHLVRVYTINCNDEININLCWQQNPDLIVPLVRWYTFPQVLADSREASKSRSFKDYPADLLNVAHRSYIKKQRRDLISLRHATLRYIVSVLDHLNSPDQNESSDSTSSSYKSEFFSKLPLEFKTLIALGGRSSRNNRGNEENAAGKFFENIVERTKECAKALRHNKDENFLVENFIVFEKPGSYVGKTLVADWSNWTCKADARDRPNSKVFIFHYSDDLNLLSSLKIVDHKSSHHKITLDNKEVQSREPLLLYVETDLHQTALDKLEFHLLASNQSHAQLAPERRLRRHTAYRTYDQQPSLEKYYASLKFRDPRAKNSYKQSLQQMTRKRLRRSANETIDYNEAENINWGPEYIYPGEESIRFRFNQIVAHKINTSSSAINLPTENIPGAQFQGENPGEIARKKSNNNGSALIPAKDDDLTLLKLTDYYKVLDEIVHKNILSRAELDGYQLMASTCFLRHLSRLFPFQGQQNGQQKSVARHYLELLYQKFSDLMTKKGAKTIQGCASNLASAQRSELEKLKISTKELQDIQNHTRKEFDVGLPSEKHFKWQYCAGSSEYLRGHTCSLWILFHTLTVHEYINREQKIILQKQQNCAKQSNSSSNDDSSDYKFMIKYSKDKAKCDPGNPEPTLLSAKTSELFEDMTHFTLSNIINFVRYYLPCTNCAAHFNCMVNNSPGLNLCNPKPDDHILWLWEAHNRVNVRTKSTHSEDPNRPKHVFPVYEACPECYLERPTDQTSFEQMKFNRKALVEFIVSRYRKSAILNNKIKIEDLFRKQYQSRAAPATSSNSSSSSGASAGRQSTNEASRGNEPSRLYHRLPLSAFVM